MEFSDQEPQAKPFTPQYQPEVLKPVKTVVPTKSTGLKVKTQPVFHKIPSAQVTNKQIGITNPVVPRAAKVMRGIPTATAARAEAREKMREQRILSENKTEKSAGIGRVNTMIKRPFK